MNCGVVRVQEVRYLSIATTDRARVTRGFHVCAQGVCPLRGGSNHTMVHACGPVVRCVFGVWHIHGSVYRAEPNSGGREAFVQLLL